MNKSVKNEEDDGEQQQQQPGIGGDEGPHAEADRRRKRKREDDDTTITGADAGEGGNGEEDEDNQMDSEMYYKIRKMYAEGLAKTVFSESVTDKGENYVLSGQAQSAIADLALDFSRMLAVDAISFAHHAKRTRITIDDVKLFCRRNPSTKKALDEVIAAFTSGPAGAGASSASGAPSPNVSKKSSGSSSSSSSSRKTSPSAPPKKKEAKGSGITVNSPPQQPIPPPVAKSTKGQRAQKGGNTSPTIQGKQPSPGPSGNNESSYFGARSRGSPNVSSSRTATSTSTSTNNGKNSKNSKNNSYLDDDDDFFLGDFDDLIQ